jgi:hypothetical protein
MAATKTIPTSASFAAIQSILNQYRKSTAYKKIKKYLSNLGILHLLVYSLSESNSFSYWRVTEIAKAILLHATFKK